MKRVKWFLITMLLAIMAFGSSCGSRAESGDKLFENVSVSSDFTISRYQNDHYERLYIGGSSQEESGKIKQEILEALKKASYRRSDLADEAKEPFYAIDLCEVLEGDESHELIAAYTGGRLVFPDGTVYQTDLDFEQLIKNGMYRLYSWQEEKKESAGAYNSFYWLLKGNDGFRRELLRTGTRFGEHAVKSPEGIKLIPEGISDEGVLKASLVNDSDQDWITGESDYRVDVLLDSKWCRVPTLPDSRYTLESLLIGKELQPGGTLTRTYPIQEVYGKLPARRYRVVEYQTELTIEFDSTEEGKLQLPRYPWGAVLIDDYEEFTSLNPGDYLYRIYEIDVTYRKLLPGHYMIWEANGPAAEFDVKDEDGKTVIVP